MFHVGEEVIGGASAGVVGTLLGFPLDLAKTRMQTSSSEATRGALSLLLHIFRSEGVRNLYKGVGPPLLSLSVVNTVSFTSYSFFNKTLFFGQEGWDWRNALAGMCGSPVFGLITTPENLLKTQMQLDNVQAERHRGRFANSFHCAQSLVKTHGATILYTGHMINTVREACFVGTYFFCYEGMKQEFQRRLVKMERRLLPSSKEEIWSSTFAVPMAGGIAGATAWFITFPLGRCWKAKLSQVDIPMMTEGKPNLPLFSNRLHSSWSTGPVDPTGIWRDSPNAWCGGDNEETSSRERTTWVVFGGWPVDRTSLPCFIFPLFGL